MKWILLFLILGGSSEENLAVYDSFDSVEACHESAMIVMKKAEDAGVRVAGLCVLDENVREVEMPRTVSTDKKVY